MDVVERLVDRSLVVVDGSIDPGGAVPRYRLLDSVRAFARERAAEAGVADVLADAVVGWVQQMAATVAAGVRGPDQAALVARTAAERATVDTALDRARQDDPVTALAIAADLGWAWVLLDDVAGAARLRAARTPDAPRALQARALLLESWIEAMSGDLAAARRALDAGTVLAGDDPQLAAWHAGFVLSQEGRFPEALATLESCRAGYAARGCAWAEGGSALLAAFAHLGRGDTMAGRTACEAAIRILTPLGDTWALLHAEAALGRVAQAEGRYTDAARHHAHAVAPRTPSASRAPRLCTGRTSAGPSTRRAIPRPSRPSGRRPTRPSAGATCACSPALASR